VRNLDPTYMAICEEIAKLSYCNRKKVGALLVNNGNIISFGYNGTPYGFCNDCEDSEGNTLDTVMHAESNAILKCAEQGRSTNGSTLYITMSPCMSCAKLIIQAKIKKVVYKELYRSASAIYLLEQSNIEIVKYENRKDLL